MADVKWIKLSTSMFEDEKIRLIESLPDADTLLIIWIKLLSQAGRTNANGYIFLSENIPFTEEMLSTLFNRPIATVRLALQTFKQFGMIDITDDQYICISNWEKHQNVDGLEKIREQNRLRKQKQREKLRLETSRDSHGTITQSHATDIEEDKELDIDKDKKKDKKKKEKPSRHKFETCDTNGAKYLFEKIKGNNPKQKEPNFDNWANEFRLMRERDNREPQEIKDVIDWCQADPFWQGNILSPKKLREKFDQLTIQMKSKKGAKNNAESSGSNTNRYSQKGEYDYGF
ncbi:TPA: phage replisome organizer N-terminal domain-containing protein [Bacillus cereus]|uniref:phage replisome organizer N-terminal domain-containing protein n=1 Tax=unclassified Bacillus (in: firmicutes) TaxID=185979 RepID=UPI0008873C2D|nr:MULTISPECIES: phage replisome organizer N-terminal domain-containing protein [unclassified Bacillus (in: firmicutes)]MCU5708056.1 phage replisome organizer N-terminal domain-containing protein [Bacillus cereus]MEC2500823.1 phage replisome organizer N-terminal domain-containing protein [Bacillus cereus]SDJ68656.1 phage replisome organizer, putative, N-terminal region [Bacillus sp. cl96]SHK25017.1 phage replisome organizer, putative, N-terminal region [Bacillus sp. cl25]HDR8199889.1 phage rep